MTYFKIIIGNLLFTSAYTFIAIPKGIVNGGVTSFAMVLGRITGMDIALLTNSLLAALLLACLVFLDRAYFFSALFSGFCYMLMFTMFYNLAFEVNLPVTASVPLAAVLVGVGYYCCIIARSTSVGFDTVAIILHRKNPKISIALVMYICNLLVLSLGFFTYGWISVVAGIMFAGLQSLTLHLLLKNFPPVRCKP